MTDAYQQALAQAATDLATDAGTPPYPRLAAPDEPATTYHDPTPAGAHQQQ